MAIKELNEEFPLKEGSINSAEISKKALKKDNDERELYQKNLKAQSSQKRQGYVNFQPQRKKA